MATADSRTPASTPRIPTTMFRRIGRRAYRMSATIAVVLPTPPRNGSGRRKLKTARLGTVCTTFTTPRVQRRSRARRTRIMADGAAITTATNTATATSHRCSADNLTISASGMRFVGCPLSQGCEERHRLWRSRLDKLIRPGHNFQPPFLQQRDPGAEHERFANVVGDEKRGRAGSYTSLRPAFQLRNKPDVLSHGRVREKPALLDHIAHTPPQANRVPVLDGLPFDPTSPPLGPTSRFTILSKVVSPEPLRPNSATVSPSSTHRSMPWRISRPPIW